MKQIYSQAVTFSPGSLRGLGLATSTKCKPGQWLSAEVKKNNRFINRLRSVVERVIAQIKIWRILHTGFRSALGSYGRVFSSGAGLVFLAVGGTL